MTTLPHFEPRRELGRTGFKATALGIGDLADRSLQADDLVGYLHRLMDAGLNLIDTAPGYEAGYSEEVVGRALRGRRDGMFVITKIDFLDKPVAAQVEESLLRMRLEEVDLLVFHAVSTLEQWDALAAPGGAFDQLEKVVASGKARFRGISCHNPEVLARAIPSGLCDVVMFPVGPAVHQRYVDESLPLAKKHGVGSVCFKTFGAGKLLGDTSGYGAPLRARPRGKFGSGGTAVAESQLPRLDVETCLRYTMTLDPDVALLGLSMPNEQDAALHAASRFAPFTSEQMEEVRQRSGEAMEGKGGCHWNPDPQKIFG
jgi:aryl-alcohol dehydrogenase-like predicted oxidoreductase